MKVIGQIELKLSAANVYSKLSDARFFASCIEGVSNLIEKSPNVYSATLETKVAYIKLKFEISVEIIEKVEPSRIVAKSEGTPIGMVGRLVSISSANLIEKDGKTLVDYEIDVSLTGKLGSLGQPVIRSKIKEMEFQFTKHLKQAFNLAEE
jgi:carbon monoxide dehydrogenase subunit G